MAFKTVIDLSTDTVISIGGFNKKTRTDNPESIEGYFLGSKKVVSAKSSTGFSAIHVFQTSKGNVGVWGKTDLDNKLGNVALGTMTRVTFAGMQKTAKNEMYKFNVATDSENTIEVDAPQGNSYQDGGDDDAAYADTGGEQGTTGSFDDEDAAQALALAQAEKKAANAAKVQALLSKKGSKVS